LVKLVSVPLLVYSAAVSLIGVLTTNAVPPKIEGDYLKIGYNYLYNWKFLVDNNSGSYLYNTYASGSMTLMGYGLAMLGVIVATYLVLLAFSLRRQSND
jgi:hypothetical protein